MGKAKKKKSKRRGNYYVTCYVSKRWVLEKEKLLIDQRKKKINKHSLYVKVDEHCDSLRLLLLICKEKKEKFYDEKGREEILNKESGMMDLKYLF